MIEYRAARIAALALLRAAREASRAYALDESALDRLMRVALLARTDAVLARDAYYTAEVRGFEPA